MKLTKTKLKQIIKEELLKEISGKQKAHDARLSSQMAEKEKKEALLDELRDLLPPEYQVHIKYLQDEARYVAVVYKQKEDDIDVASRGWQDMQSSADELNRVYGELGVRVEVEHRQAGGEALVEDYPGGDVEIFYDTYDAEQDIEDRKLDNRL